MTYALSPKPNLEHHRKRAKTLLRQHKQGVVSCCDTLKYHERFVNLSEEEILGAEISLFEVQHAISKSYGFKSWRELKAFIQTATGREAIRHVGGRAWIEGVPDGTFGFQWDMLVNAMQTLLAFRGVKTSRNELLVYSGDAFNLCHASNWQGTGYLAVPVDTMANMARAYGFGYECINDGYGDEKLNKLSHAEQLMATQEALDRIWVEIDAGRPALVGGAEAHCGSWTLAVGYDRNKAEMCHIGDGEAYRWTKIRGVAPGSVDEEFGHINGRFRGAVRDGFVGGWQCNPAFLIKEKDNTVSKEERALVALEDAVRLHQAPKNSIGWWGNVDFFFGEEAYEKWSEALRNLDYPSDLETEKPDGAYDWYSMGNMDTQVDQIIKGRSAAAEFCGKVADVLSVDKDCLHRAAVHYRQEVDLAKKEFAVFIPPWSGPGEPRLGWLADKNKCRNGAKVVLQMLELERAAVAQISKALQRSRTRFN